jgi:hypothetical protein
MKKTPKKSVQRKSIPLRPLPPRPGIFYSPVNACAAPGVQGRNAINLASHPAGMLDVTAHDPVHFDSLQWVAIAMPVALGTPIKGLSVSYQIVYPAGIRPGRTYIVNPSLMEINASGVSLNLLSDTMQLNAAQPTTYTTSAGLAANKTAVGPLTCSLQIVIGDPQDVIMINGVKLVTG